MFDACIQNVHQYIAYCKWEIFGRGKLENLASHELFAKIFLSNIDRYTENVFGICTDRILFAKFFLTNSFCLYGLPKFAPAKYFPCMAITLLPSYFKMYPCKKRAIRYSSPSIIWPLIILTLFYPNNFKLNTTIEIFIVVLG